MANYDLIPSQRGSNLPYNSYYFTPSYALLAMIDSISKLVHGRKMIEAETKMRIAYREAQKEERAYFVDRMAAIALSAHDDNIKLSMFHTLERLFEQL